MSDQLPTKDQLNQMMCMLLRLLPTLSKHPLPEKAEKALRQAAEDAEIERATLRDEPWGSSNIQVLGLRVSAILKAFAVHCGPESIPGFLGVVVAPMHIPERGRLMVLNQLKEVNGDKPLVDLWCLLKKTMNTHQDTWAKTPQDLICSRDKAKDNGDRERSLLHAVCNLAFFVLPHTTFSLQASFSMLVETFKGSFPDYKNNLIPLNAHMFDTWLHWLAVQALNGVYTLLTQVICTVAYFPNIPPGTLTLIVMGLLSDCPIALMGEAIFREFASNVKALATGILQKATKKKSQRQSHEKIQMVDTLDGVSPKKAKH